MGYVMRRKNAKSEQANEMRKKQPKNKEPTLVQGSLLDQDISRSKSLRDTDMEEIYEMIWNDRKLY